MNRRSIINQAEQGFAAYINGNTLGTVLQGVEGLAAHTLTPLPLDVEGNPTGFANIIPPYVIFTGSAPSQIGYDSGIYELTLKAELDVQIDVSQAIPGTNAFADYVEALRDLLEGQDNGGNLLAMNWLNSASPINFTNFGLSALAFTGEQLSTPPDGRHLVCELTYYIGATTQSS